MLELGTVTHIIYLPSMAEIHFNLTLCTVQERRFAFTLYNEFMLGILVGLMNPAVTDQIKGILSLTSPPDRFLAFK